jgi:hypothetical protein
VSIAARFRHSLTISRYALSGTPNARGNQARSYVDDDLPIRGNLQERAAREVPTGELAAVAISNAIVFLPLDTNITASDRIKLGALVYEVLGLSRDAGGRGRHLEADLRRVTP